MTDRSPYVPPSLSVFGVGVYETLLDRARRVAEAANARPGETPCLASRELPGLLSELGIAVWGAEETERRGPSQSGAPSDARFVGDQ